MNREKDRCCGSKETCLRVSVHEKLQTKLPTVIIIIIIILSHCQSTFWMNASAFLFHDNLSWAFCFHVTDLQKSSISSLYLFEGLPLGQLPSIGLQSVTWDVHLLSWMRAMWPAKVHFLALMTCMMSRTLVFSLSTRLSYDLARKHQSLPFPYFFEWLLGAAPRLWIMSMVSDA